MKHNGATARASLLGAAIVMAASAASGETPSPTAVKTIKAITATAQFKRAEATFAAGHDQWVKDIITITEIPAPPFKETVRAKAFLEMLRAEGLTDLEIDAEGNVLGIRTGTQRGGKAVVVSAHLDTVFPEGTDVKVRREGDRLYAPGVGDDSTGLATLLQTLRAMNAAGYKTKNDIIFMGTVGEEGLGDLRGVRYLHTKGKYKDRIGAFFSIDGGGLDSFTAGGTGSKRYKVTFKGPGGHSYGAFGLVNPMTAMSQAVVDFYKTTVPTSPKTTYSASVVGGGTSVNAIPREVWMQFDMRSDSAEELAKVEQSLLAAVDNAVKIENAARSTKEGQISADKKLIGDRPAGHTDAKADIVQYGLAAYGLQGGGDVGLRYGSTDSNVAMSLGIPAITLSRIAVQGRGHSVDEWVEVTKGPNVKIMAANLAIILAVANGR